MPIRNKMNLDLYFTPYKKINLIKLLEENIGENVGVLNIS